MATTFCCGAECNLLGGTIRHWTGADAGTPPTLSTAVVRTGTYSYLFDYSGAADSGYLNHAASTPNVAVVRLYAYFTQFPNATVALVDIRESGGSSLSRLQMNSSGQLRTYSLNAAPETTGAFGSALSLNTWYRIDVKGDFNNGTTTDASVDGAGIAQSTDGSTTRTISSVRIGPSSTATTVKVYYDDIVIAEGNAGDYPINAGNVRAYSPNEDGTHSFTAGDFKYDSTTNIATSATDVYSYVDDLPDNNTDYVYQAVVNGSGYLEVQMPTTGLTNVIKGVSCMVRYQGSSGSPANATWKLNDGGTLDDIFGGTFSTSGGLVAQKTYATKPSGGDWTNAALGATRVRYGYSSDISPQPRWQSTLFEVDFRDTVEASGVRSFAVMVG